MSLPLLGPAGHVTAWEYECQQTKSSGWVRSNKSLLYSQIFDHPISKYPPPLSPLYRRYITYWNSPITPTLFSPPLERDTRGQFPWSIGTASCDFQLTGFAFWKGSICTCWSIGQGGGGLKKRSTIDLCCLSGINLAYIVSEASPGTTPRPIAQHALPD